MRNSHLEISVSAREEPSRREDYRARIARLFESMRPDLLRFAYWLARDRSTAEDIVQESMLRAWRCRDALKDPRALRAWLLTIVRREHARLYARKRFEVFCLDDGIEHDDYAVSEEPDRELLTLRQGILKLPIEYCEPLVMQVLGGFSTQEIAREMSLSVTAVLTRLYRARNKLRDLRFNPGTGGAVRREPAETCTCARLLIGWDPTPCARARGAC